MEITLAQRAIDLALKGEWEEAIKINLQILDETPDDVDALNRLARAYAETGKIGKAREAAGDVLKIDPFNPIAQKGLDRWSTAKNGHKNGHTHIVSSEMFLEESGKTKIVSLINTGESKLLATLDPGVEVKIMCYPHKVSVVTHDDKYLGKIPDDLAARLRMLVKAGNKYNVLIKSVDTKEVAVFIRETERGAEAPNMPSFPTEKIEYVSFTPPELVHKDGLENSPHEEPTED